VWLLYPLVIIGAWLGLRLIDGRGLPKPREWLQQLVARLKRTSGPSTTA
jgi:hypothetical protein